MNIKYPKTYHLPWSQTLGSDDKIQNDLSYLSDIVVTEKMDGENTTMTNNRVYARSIDSLHHVSQSYVKGIWGRIKHLIPDNFRICGENLAAKHSIYYNNLVDFFLVFSIWDGEVCLDWQTTEEIVAEWRLNLVPILWKGKFEKNMMMDFHHNLDLNKTEGYVVRNISSFELCNFQKNVIKFVRKNHVTSEKHWKSKEIVYNYKL